jgi:hypothetical protein
MPMNVLIILASLALTLTATQAQECVLSDTDVTSLAASPSHLTSDMFLALKPAGQKAVCTTRAAVKQLDAQNGVMIDSTIKITMSYSAKYLSPSENDRIVGAGNDWFEKTMKSKGY